MVDLNLRVPATDPVEVPAETSAAIHRGLDDANAGRTVSIEEARRLMVKWISKVRISEAALTDFEEILT